MANRFLSNIRINDAYTLPASDGTVGQVIGTDGAGNLSFVDQQGADEGATLIYVDSFSGDGSTTDFLLSQSIDNEVKTFVYIDGVYQEKDTYEIPQNTNSLEFSTAPPNGTSIEVVIFFSVAAEDYNQKLLFYGKASGAISKGDAVMFAGVEGDHFLIARATQAAISANHEYFLGLAAQDLVNNEFGYVVEFGRLNQIDTTGFTAGDTLWFDAGGTVAGALTNTEPAAPLAKIQVAAVIKEHQNEGVLFVRPTWYHELGELHDVNIDTVADKDLLTWNATAGYWENSKTLGDITTGNITTSGTVDGVDVSAFKSDYDAHTHTESEITDFGNYVTGVTHDAANTKLVVTTRDGLTQDLDISQYIDDTNLAYIQSGTLDGATGIATFTRDDATSFTVDLSALLDDTDTNDFVTGASFNTGDGVLTLTVQNQPNVTVDLDGRYLQSYTETDTLASVTGRGSSTSTFSSFNGGLTATKINKGSYGIQIKGAYYGSPRLQLYDLSADSNAFVGLGVDMSGGAYEMNAYFPRYNGYGRFSIGSWAGDFGTGQYVSGYNEKMYITETTAGFNVPLSINGTISATGYNSSNWDTAYGWGDHAGLYLPISGKAADSNLLDGIDSSNFFRTDGTYPNTDMNDTVEGYWHVASGSANLPVNYYGHRWDYDHTQNGQWVFQMYSPTGGDVDLWFRQKRDHSATSWQKVLTSDNVGSYALTSYTETSTLDAVADRGRSTNQQLISTNPSGFRVDSGSYARIELDSTDNWSYIRMQDQGTTTWDIACYNSGNLEWRPGGGSANRMWLSQSGNLTMESGTVYIGSNAVIHAGNIGSQSVSNADTVDGYHASGLLIKSQPIFSSSTDDDTTGPLEFSRDNGWDDYIIKHGASRGLFGKKGFGWHFDSSSTFHVLSSGWTANFGVNSDGTTISRGSSRAPIFYDYTNTGYYLNPDGTSNLLGPLNIYNGDGAANPRLSVGRSSAQAFHFSVDDRVATITHQQDEGSGEHSMEFYINSPTASNDKVFRWKTNDGTLSYLDSAGFKSNVYYDRDNTSYYADPAATSNFSRLDLQAYSFFNSGLQVKRNIGTTSPSWQDANHTLSLENNDAGYLSINFHRAGYTSNNIYYTGTEIIVDDTYRSTVDMRAPIFYDSNNTGYYLHPDATSNLGGLEISGSAHKYLYINPGPGYEAMVRFNGGSGSTWYVGSRTSTQLIGSTDAWHVYSQTRGETVSGTDNEGNTFARSSSRAPIFYDSNNTSYSVNPDGTSYLLGLTVNGSIDNYGGVNIYSNLLVTGNITGTQAIGVDKTSTYGTGIDLTYSGSFSTGMIIRNNTGSVDQVGIGFYYSSAAQGPRGWISIGTSSVSYNTGSDYRLKENVVPMTGALDRVSLLKPSRFNFIGDDKVVDGFLAHEAAEVVPEAVTGEKDAVDEDGNPKYQGIDQAKLVPLLVGAIQELKAEVEALKQQLNGIN